MNSATTLPPQSGFAAARKAMLDSQLRTSGVSEDFVLARMGSVPREDFVPEGARGFAYMDRAIALTDGGHLAAPIVHGKMLAEAKPKADDTVLLVDGGSGYLAELVRPLVGALEVITPDDAVAATRKRGDFTLLLVDGAVAELPAGLTKRLANDARVVTGLWQDGVTRLAVGRKTAGDVALLPVADIGIPHLPQFDVAKGWSF